MKARQLLLRINRAFLIQAALIALAVLLSVFVAKVMIEEVLIRSAITQEATFFWEAYNEDKSHPLPKTFNLTGAFSPSELSLPKTLNINESGFQAFSQGANSFVLLVTERKNQKLYLLYNRGQVDQLVAYYGLAPLAMVLVILYLALWFSYRVSHRTISPVVKLAEQVNAIDFKSKTLNEVSLDEFTLNTQDDIQILSDAIVGLGSRLNKFIQREQEFTRDASHELRSPLTVIQMAMDVVKADAKLSEDSARAIQRIERSLDDMKMLIKAFLLLARESDDGLALETVSINQVLEDEVERCRLITELKQLEVKVESTNSLFIETSEKVLSILLGNLIRNAVMYTEQGQVKITVENKTVVITDSGIGIDSDQLESVFDPHHRGEHAVPGFGVGLTIVKRLSERFQWPVKIKSTLGKGTTVEILFPQAKII